MGVGQQRMRIIGGRFAGRRIAAPPGSSTRPTTDRVRESLMSSIISRLGESVESAVVLDPFAGSGALGLEALSRGATRVTFVERDRTAFSVLKENVSTLGCTERATLMLGDASSLLNPIISHGPYSLILLDPPYTLDPTVVERLLGGLLAAGAIDPDALITWEHSSGVGVTWPGGFEPVASKRYGSTHIDFAVVGEGEHNS